MKQQVKFTYLEFEIEAQIEWEGSDFSINFFDPQTGYTNNSNPSSIMSNWSYLDPTDNYEMQNLIEAINNFYYQHGTGWVEHLTWEDGATDTFTFAWDSESYLPEVCYINHDGEQVYYKQLDLIR